jgi:hypothetical protein
MGEGTGGGVDTDVGGAGQDTGGGRDTSPSTPASLGFGGARGDIVARDTTPAPNVQPSFTYEAPVITTDPERDFGRSGLFSFFTPKIEAATSYYDPSGLSQPLGSGPVNPFTQGLATLTGGGGGGSGDSPSVSTTMEGTGVQADPTTYANVPESINQTRIRDLYRQDSPSLGGARFGSPEQKAFGSGRMFPANVGFTSPSAPTVDQTSPSMVTQDFPPLGGTGVSPETVRSRRFDEPDPGAIVGPIQTFQNIIDPIDPLQTVYQRGFTPGEDVGMLYGRGFDPTPSGALTQVTLPAARPSVIDTQPKTDANAAAAKLAALARSGGAKTKEELNLVQRFGRFLQGLGKGISNFQMSDIFEFLKGDPNYKGPSPAQQQLMGVPGPGPAVGGGAPLILHCNSVYRLLHRTHQQILRPLLLHPRHPHQEPHRLLRVV